MKLEKFIKEQIGAVQDIDSIDYLDLVVCLDQNAEVVNNSNNTVTFRINKVIAKK